VWIGDEQGPHPRPKDAAFGEQNQLLIPDGRNNLTRQQIIHAVRGVRD
jgi:hypothetical protein